MYCFREALREAYELPINYKCMDDIDMSIIYDAIIRFAYLRKLMTFSLTEQ